MPAAANCRMDTGADHDGMELRANTAAVASGAKNVAGRIADRWGTGADSKLGMRENSRRGKKLKHFSLAHCRRITISNYLPILCNARPPPSPAIVSKSAIRLGRILLRCKSQETSQKSVWRGIAVIPATFHAPRFKPGIFRLPRRPGASIPYLSRMNLKQLLERIAAAVNRTDLRILVFILLFLNTFSLVLTENEEEYFAFAKRFMNPDWMPGSMSLRDLPGGRIIFDTVIGWVLGFAGFGTVAIVGRTLAALFLAFPLARLFRKAGLSNLAGLLMLQGLCLLAHQSFYGFEWIFGGFEAKVVCYGFVFYSICFYLEDRFWPAVVLAAVSVYFHILVGGWYGIVMFACWWISGIPFKRMLAGGAAYLAIAGPMAAYLFLYYVMGNPSTIDGVEVSRVYVYVRNPHHLDMLAKLAHFGSTAQSGILMSIIFCGWCLKLYFKNQPGVLKKIALMSVVLFAQQFVSLIIACFDHGGEFLKFYPYRTSALSLFLMLVVVMLAIQAFQQRRPAEHGAEASVRSPAFAAPMLVLLALGLGCKLAGNVKESWKHEQPDAEAVARAETYDWIRRHTSAGSVFLNMGKVFPLDFIRATSRESFSVYKFVPTTNRLIYEWYVRVEEATAVNQDIKRLPELRKRRKIDYVASREPLDAPGLVLVHADQFHFIYQTEDRLD